MHNQLHQLPSIPQKTLTALTWSQDKNGNYVCTVNKGLVLHLDNKLIIIIIILRSLNQVNIMTTFSVKLPPSYATV